MNYYNEWDKPTAAWLRELIKQGCIPPGDVDERDIREVKAHELKQYTQCHFFAGIGGWSLALDLAGWPRTRPVWTGSCPCQPFSNAGARKGKADSRHLWPEFLRLIADGSPANLFGEQVASKLGREWLSGVQSDLEALGLVFGAADLCSAGVGAPHIRQRLWWGAHDPRRMGSPIRPRRQTPRRGFEIDSGVESVTRCSVIADRLGDANAERCAGQRLRIRQGRPFEDTVETAGGGAPLRMGEPIRARLERLAGDGDDRDEPRRQHATATGPATTASADGRLGDPTQQQARDTRFPWRQSDAVHCSDGKARRVEPGTFPLAHGIPARVGRLRGYGNAINPWVAKEFVEAFLEIEGGLY